MAAGGWQWPTVYSEFKLHSVNKFDVGLVTGRHILNWDDKSFNIFSGHAMPSCGYDRTDRLCPPHFPGHHLTSIILYNIHK